VNKYMCCMCGKRWVADNPPASQSWCSPECHDLWETQNPEEAAKWIKVGDLNAMQRAELDAIIGNAGKA